MRPGSHATATTAQTPPPVWASARSALSTVVYRSRAVEHMSLPALNDLTGTAQARNSREDLTGLMLYDSGHFFQWLEGPAGNVDRVMKSILRDPRHTDIEVLNNQSVPARTFGAWSMKLATHGPEVATMRHDVIEPPPEVVEGLRKRPEAAPVLLKRLVPHTENATRPDATSDLRLNKNTASILKSVILSTVLPTLTHGAPGINPTGALLPPSARTADLAELLIATDQAASVALIQEMRTGLGSMARLYTTLLEPAARTLGDLWDDGICSDFDLALSLCRLQTAIRLLTADALPELPGLVVQPSVLIVPDPGERHWIGATLDSSILGHAGWSPHCAYPEDDQALQDILSSGWFDVLDLSLSIALRREHLLPRLAETIAHARRASQNPALVVVVGGRVFVETSAAGSSVGADLASRTSGNVDVAILRAMSETNTSTVTVNEILQVQPTAS